MPPIKIRAATTYNQQLGLNALPLGFISIPIFSHKEADLLDDLDLNGCGYVNTVDGYTFPLEATYDSVDYLLDQLRIPISDCYNLSESAESSMTFMQLYNWCDVVQSREFEGIKTCDSTMNFTDVELSQVN